MRYGFRSTLAALLILAIQTSECFAQVLNPLQPVPQNPQAGPRVQPPGMLPPSIATTSTPSSNVPLPQSEHFVTIDADGLTVRDLRDEWTLTYGAQVLVNFGRDRNAAEQAKFLLRVLRPNSWSAVGSVGLYYGLANGKAVLAQGANLPALPIDLKSARAEPVRGVWVLKDDRNIFVNFGLDRESAEQAAAVVQKYGYNRLAVVGRAPSRFSFLFAESGSNFASNNTNSQALPAPVQALQMAAAERNLGRTGVPVPGAGFVGERILIEARTLEVRRERGEFLLVSGTEIIGNFGPAEWAARDAQKLIQEARFTEFCRVGETTFFLVNGAAPTRIPFNVTTRSFDPKSIRARAIDQRFGVFDGIGRLLFYTATLEEAEQMTQVIQGYGFDTFCQLGMSARTSLKFLAKTSHAK